MGRCVRRSKRSVRKRGKHAVGAGCANGLHVKAILNDLGMRAKINLRCDAKAARALAETRFVQENTARESKVLVRARPCQGKRSRSVASTNRNDPDGHPDETLDQSQIGIHQGFDGKELRERDDVPSRPWRAR